MKRRRRAGEAVPAGTPAWCVDRLLEAWTPPRWAKRWIDPCVGTGAMLDRFDEKVRGLRWCAVDVEGKACEWLRARRPDIPVACENMVSLAYAQKDAYDVVAMHPPPLRSQLDEMVQAALFMAPIVVALVRLTFLVGRSRQLWLSNRMPERVLVLADRPWSAASTTPVQRGNAADHAWMIWGRAPLSSSRLELLPPTPAAERGAHRRTR